MDNAEYRITVRSNPRVFAVVAFIIVLPAIGVVLFIVTTPLLGVIGIVVGSYFSYSFFKLLRGILISRIRITDASMVFYFGKKDVDTFSWDEISFAGAYTLKGKNEHLFVYAEEGDRLVTVPQEYEDFAGIKENMKSRLTNAEFTEFAFEDDDELKEYLREQIKVDEPVADEPDDGIPEDTTDE